MIRLKGFVNWQTMDTDDEIDSDLEALLYSQVHYKETLSVNLDTDTFNFTGHSQGLVKKSRLTWSIQKLLSSDEEEVWSDNKYNVTNKPSDTCILRNSVTKFVSSLKSHGVAQEQNNTAKKSPSEHMALCFAKENSHASQLNYFLDSDIEIMPDDVTATVTLQQRNMHQKMALNNGKPQYANRIPVK